MTANPILRMTSDPADPVPLVELKQHLVFFAPDPPGPLTARRIYDGYLRAVGDIFTQYRSTFPSAPLTAWTPAERAYFEQVRLPALRSTVDWGYGFSDGKPVDSWLLMFHGFRPFREPEKASFYRFEFDWQVDCVFLRNLAESMMRHFPFLSGYGGYLLQGRPSSPHAATSYDSLYALARRYWCCEVEDIELTAEQMKLGYKCVNWLTLIGEPFRARFPEAIEQAKAAAYAHAEGPHGVLFQVSERPLLGDRNRQANLDAYFKVAEALLPMQMKTHRPFWSERWQNEETMAWARRFTHPWP
jgi:hypothetical protein